MPLSVENIHATIGDYQRPYIYKIFIESVPAPILAEFPNSLSFQKEVDIYNKKAVWPDRKTKEITIKWGGEFFDIPGVDASTRNTSLEMFDDEANTAYDFFYALKNLTGNEQNQAGVFGTLAKFNMGIAMVSVDKQTITSYRRLVGVRVYELERQEPDKGAEDINPLKVGIRWDRNQEDKSKRGKQV